VTSLDASWRFNRSDVAGAQDVSFDDSAWGTVTLPHTWNNLDGQDGGNDYYRGIGWYRRHYAVPDDQAGRELFIRFDGASLVTDLWVNGAFVGEHKGGFAAFVWDVTPYLRVGADNVLAVKVNNALNLDVAPLYGDFTMDGGIYRHVSLIATDPLHVSLTDYASPGVYVRQTNVSDARADLSVATKLRNDDAVRRGATVVAEVVDASGKVVASLESTQTLGAGTSLDVVQDATLDGPHLWDGRADPYLYHACVRVIDPDSGEVVDQVVQPLGLRSYRVDPADGFFLNGHYLDLHGVNFHQDRLDKGWAISDDDQREDVGLIREAGATFVRLSHYQHPPLIYDLLDASGIVAWSEIPFVNGAFNSEAFFANAGQQLREMIRQNCNHPAVLFWGMFNEVGDNPVERALVGELVRIAHEEDPDRLTTAATYLGADAAINALPDVIGFNVYYGWYYGRTTDFGVWADAAHRNFPGRAIGVSEYGAGASIYQHQDDPPPPPPGGPWHPEEYQDLFHESHWRQMSTRPFLWAKTVWNMFDFASDGRDEGDTPGRNDKGLITYDRRTRKDAFYWYKANWSADPVLYITSRRYVKRPTNTVEVKVYSNLDEVGLTVNGVSWGAVRSPDHIFRWANAVLGPGQSAIEVRATRDGTTYTDDVNWSAPGAPAGQPFAGADRQPAGVVVPGGYHADYGPAFGDRGHGLVRGWGADGSAPTRGDGPTTAAPSFSSLPGRKDDATPSSLVTDTYRTQLRVTGITLVEDPARPEPWPRDAAFEYWDAAGGRWIKDLPAVEK
jgi:beta-galactosidase